MRVKALLYPVVIYIMVNYVKSVANSIAANFVVVGFEKVKILDLTIECLLGG